MSQPTNVNPVSKVPPSLPYADDATPHHPSATVQTGAMLLDAYRELNHKKLFWLTLGLSGLVVAAFAAVGIGPKGVSFLGYTIIEAYNSGTFPPPTFFKMIYATIAVPQWLGWLGSILAIVSTASIFPDFLTAGSVDLYLSKPISRVRLFLTKYLMGLLFVALQVSVFTLASYLILGIRGGVWTSGIFLTIPIILLFFSYLWAISTLIGVLTRSTIASILLTLLAWFMIFGVTTTEQALDMFKTAKQARIESTKRAADSADDVATKLKATTKPDSNAVSQWEYQSTERKKELVELESDLSTLKLFHGLAWWAKAPLPKTSETVDLLRRALVKYSDMPADDGSNNSGVTVTTGNNRNANRDAYRAQRRKERHEVEEVAQQIADSRSITFTLGTSIAFEFVVVGIACWVFCRRDY